MYNIYKRWYLHGFVPFLDLQLQTSMKLATPRHHATSSAHTTTRHPATKTGRDWDNSPLGTTKFAKFPKIWDTFLLSNCRLLHYLFRWTSSYSQCQSATPIRHLLLTISALSLQISSSQWERNENIRMILGANSFGGRMYGQIWMIQMIFLVQMTNFWGVQLFEKIMNDKYGAEFYHLFFSWSWYP